MTRKQKLLIEFKNQMYTKLTELNTEIKGINGWSGWKIRCDIFYQLINLRDINRFRGLKIF